MGRSRIGSGVRIAAAGMAAAIALTAAGMAVERARLATAHVPPSAGMDLLPLYLGAHALAAHQDPTDPVVLEAQFRALGLQVPVGGFLSYYPRTASLALLPVRDTPFKSLVRPVRVALGAAIVLAAVFGVLAGAAGPAEGAWSPARRLALVAAVGAALTFTFGWSITGAILRTAQPGPLAAAAAAIGLWGLARRRDIGAGVVLALGAALKLLPGLLLVPVLLARRWRAVAAAALVGGVLFAAASALYPVLPHPDGALGAFFQPLPFPGWGSDTMRHVWEQRFWVLPPTVALVGLAARRGLPAASSGAVVLAAAGLLLAGTHHLHESVQLVPAVAWLFGGAVRPDAPRAAWLAPVAVVGTALASGALAPHSPAASLCFVPVGIVTWLGCVARLWSDARAPQG